MSGLRIVLFMAKNQWSEIVVGLVESYFPDDGIEVYRMAKKDTIPTLSNREPIDLCISFLSPCVVPIEILELSAVNVNFHPGDRNYPGIGCYNFALYEQRDFYGVVCHHMVPKVDTGGIIIEKTFPIASKETVETLQYKSFCCLVEVCREFLELYGSGASLHEELISWNRKPFTRKDLNALADIKGGIDPDEKRRRIAATTYPGFGSLEGEVPLVARVFTG